MPWTTPETRSTNDLISQTIYNNQVVRNLIYLSGRIEPKMVNNAGETLSSGTVIIRDTTANAFSTTNTANNATVFGIIEESVTGGGFARVISLGVHTVNVQGNVTRGHFLQTSTTLGRAADAGTSRTIGTFAIALESYTGGAAGTVSAFICCKQVGHDIPGKSVLWTTDTVAPTYYQEYTAAKGRTIIGLVVSGTVEGTVGTALTDLENTTHTHTYDEIIDHTHTVAYTELHAGASNATDRDKSWTGVNENHPTSTSNTGSAQGTTTTGSTLMPYIQLLAIQR